MARETYRDRFGSVGRGRVLLKGGLVDALMKLKDDGAISVARYERLYTFLDHERMGLARELYPRDTYLSQARLARSVGLEVPDPDGDRSDRVGQEIDVRALVDEIAAAF